jgi:hypothetical protein
VNWNWGLILAVLACVAFWIVVIGGLIWFLW